MKNRQILIYLFTFFLISSAVKAQEAESVVMTLEECLDYAYEHNENLLIAEKEKKKQEYYVGEIMADGFPQINGNANFTKNLKLRTTLFDVSNIDPNAPEGTFVEAQFGVEYEGDLGISATQMIFDGSYFVGLQAAKTYKELSIKEHISTKINITENVSKAYYSVLVNKEGYDIVEANYNRLDSLLSEQKAMFENGFIEKIDLNRTQVEFNNTKASLTNQQRMLNYSKQLLKFQMGMPLELSLEIADEAEDLEIEYVDNLENDINYSRRIEFQQLQVNQKLAELDLKNNHVQYIPSIDLFLNVGMSAGAPTSSELFNVGGDFWFDYQQVGLRATVPIFDGLRKAKKIQQNRIQLEQLDYQMSMLKRQINLEITDASTSLLNNLNNLKNQLENMKLAEEVYNVSKIKYEEGVGSSIELIDADNAYKQAQSNYYNALLETLLSKVDYEKALGILLENQN